MYFCCNSKAHPGLFSLVGSNPNTLSCFLLKPCSQSAFEVSVDCTPLVFASNSVSQQQKVPTCIHCISNLLPLTTSIFKLIFRINHVQSYKVFISLCLNSCNHFLILPIWLVRFLYAIQFIGGFKLCFKSNNILGPHLHMKCCVIEFELMLMKFSEPYNELEIFRYLDSLHFCVLRYCLHFFDPFMNDVIINKFPL